MEITQPSISTEDILESEGKEQIKAAVDALLNQPEIRQKIQNLLTSPGNLIDVFEGLEDAIRQQVGPEEFERIKKEATQIIEKQLTRYIITTHTGKPKEEIDNMVDEKLGAEMGKVIGNIRATAMKKDPKLAFKPLEEIQAAKVLPPEQDMLLSLILVLKKTARAAQEDASERFEKVVEQGGKYYWNTVPGKFEAWQEGYEGNALLGEKPIVKLQRKELSDADKAKYEAYKNNRETERGEFYKILDDIAAIKIDAARAASDTTGDYIKDEAHKFFNNLPQVKQKIFARFEQLLHHGSYDPELCIKRVLSYLNAIFGTRGKFVEDNETLGQEESKEILEKLDLAENIAAQLLKTMPSPQQDMHVFLELLKKAISSCGEEEKSLYLKYVHLRGVLADNDKTADSTMLYCIDCMLQLRNNGMTSNVSIGSEGCRPSRGTWKVKDHIDEFNRDMAIYREFMAFMRNLYPEDTPGVLREKLKKMCEEYRKSGSEGERLYKELSDKNTGMKNFSDTMIAELYKALLLFEKTPINIKRIKFIEAPEDSEGYGRCVDPTCTTPDVPPDIPDNEMENFRDDYARRRRGLRAFFIRHTKNQDLIDSRTAYITAYRQRITHRVFANGELNAMAIDTEEARRNFMTSVRRAVVRELLQERRLLFAREIEVHRVSQWQRLKTWFRRHPYWRLGVGAAATTGFLIASVAGAPVATVPFALARMAMWQIGWEGGWEAMQNTLGKTRTERPWRGILRRFGITRPSIMGADEARERLAAHTTLAIGTRSRNEMRETIGNLSDFYNGQTGAELWARYTRHLNTTIDRALRNLPDTATRQEIINEAINTAIREETVFMKDVESRERHMRMTDALKKITGFATGFMLFGGSLFAGKPEQPAHPPQLPKKPIEDNTVYTPEPPPPPEPPEPPYPTISNTDAEAAGVSHAAGPSIPDGSNAASQGVVDTGAGVASGNIPDHLTFRMVDSIPGDPDPGVLQALPYKLGLTPDEAHQLHSYLAHGQMDKIEQANGFLARPGIIDAYGHTRSGIDFIKPAEELTIPDGKSFIEAVQNITKGRLSADEIMKRLSS